MEYASYLAGEKWSDHPACTHPLLSELARQINDFVSDGSRQALVELVPDMIGSTGDDLRIDLSISLRAARTALPVAAAERQQIMAVAVLTCERLWAEVPSELVVAFARWMCVRARVAEDLVERSVTDGSGSRDPGAGLDSFA